jgi:hypothetical protein
MKTLRALFLLAFLVSGCGPTIIPFATSSQINRSYTIGQPATASVGDTMLSVHSTSSGPVYVVTQDYTPPQHDTWKGGLDYPPLTKGMEFTKVADRSDGVIGIHNPNYQITIPGAWTRDDRKEDITIWIEPSGIVSETMEGRPWEKTALFATGTNGSSVHNLQLLYAGLEGSVVSTTVHEQTGENTPQVTTIRHDLDAGKTFAVNNITIEVLKATTSAIEYRVVSDGTTSAAK